MTSALEDAIKRATDIGVAGVGLALTAPVQLAVAVAVQRQLGSPVLFRQPRPGLDGKTFELMKFRTMREPDPERGLFSDADRMTSLGSFLRRTSLDELPTLLNVLKGDMSLVGPRPLLVAYLERYTPEQTRRHEVRPGITGLAQVSGRNALTWDEKFTLDVRYVEQRSLLLDLKILLRTVTKVLRSEGITAEGSPTMPEFMGNRT